MLAEEFGRASERLRGLRRSQGDARHSTRADRRALDAAGTRPLRSSLGTSPTGHPIPTPRALSDPPQRCALAGPGATVGQRSSPLIPSDVLLDFDAAEEGSRAVLVASQAALREQIVYPLPLAAEELGRLDDRQPPDALDGLVMRRRLPESNRCTGFCRPMPNHSAKAPRVGHRIGVPSASCQAAAPASSGIISSPNACNVSSWPWVMR
jgi:hypothetical protein